MTVNEPCLMPVMRLPRSILLATVAFWATTYALFGWSGVIVTAIAAPAAAMLLILAGEASRKRSES